MISIHRTPLAKWLCYGRVNCYLNCYVLADASGRSSITLETKQGTARFTLEDVVLRGPQVFHFNAGTLVVFVRSHGLLSL